MIEYEILLLLDAELEDDREAEIIARVHELVDKSGGLWDLHDAWGRRKLAYEIGHKSDGSYHLLQFTCDASTLEEISRVLRIDDGVMRHMATRHIEGSRTSAPRDDAAPVAAAVAPIAADAAPVPEPEYAEANTGSDEE